MKARLITFAFGATLAFGSALQAQARITAWDAGSWVTGPGAQVESGRDSRETDGRWRRRAEGPEGFVPGFDPPWAPFVQHERWVDRSTKLGFGVGADLHRVDGLSMLARQSIESRPWVPSLSFYEGYGEASKRWSGAAEVRVKLGTPHLAIGMRAADETIPFFLPSQALESTENATAALFLREDYRDYLRRRGRAYFAEIRPARGQFLQLAWKDEEHDSLEREIARYGPFGGRKNFRENPAIHDGSWETLRLRAISHIGSRKSRLDWAPTPSVLADCEWIRNSEGGAAGRSVRVFAEHRGRVRLTPAQSIGYRVAGGWTPEGRRLEGASRLPEQWRFRAGGVGSLRGHRFQEFEGDRLALATIEYGVEVDEGLQPILFVDSGRAWNESERRAGGVGGSGPLEIDAGIGILLGKRGPRIDVARDLRKERAEAKVTLRLGLPY